MPALLFRLANVPDDEAADIRQLLDEHGVDYYETSGGNWGISVAAIWLRDKGQLEQARSLIAQYQSSRCQRQRDDYEERKRMGQHKTLADSFREQPLRFVLYCGIIIVILYFSIKPFVGLGG
jgi:hypothetical protein